MIRSLIISIAFTFLALQCSSARPTPFFKTLYAFNGYVNSGDGTQPTTPLVIGPGGVLYGTTYSGGISNNGTVFVSPARFTQRFLARDPDPSIQRRKGWIGTHRFGPG